MRLTWVGVGIIAIGILTPAAQLPEAPGSDKLHHIIGFFALCLPLALSQTIKMWKLAAWTLAFGGAIELMQPYINRSGEWADVLADGIGIALAIGLGLARMKLVKTRS
jgi:VanZ family protein